MTPRTKWTLDDLLPEARWPHRAIIGRSAIVGMDALGECIVAEVGENVYGRAVLGRCVGLSAGETTKLFKFLTERAS